MLVDFETQFRNAGLRHRRSEIVDPLGHSSVQRCDSHKVTDLDCKMDVLELPNLYRSMPRHIPWCTIEHRWRHPCLLWAKYVGSVFSLESHPRRESRSAKACSCQVIYSNFKNDEGYNVTVNGDRYRATITNFFIPELNNHDVQELWFQQDGATCHTARATIDSLKDTFGDRLISRFGPVNWPPRSCDLTPLDYFL
ncbi:uncharacterized protein TNCV_4767121 [Trichonephila clavipes]|nr:uncharacterized protein TNCV_4767121 [Trichonephila clavipes]